MPRSAASEHRMLRPMEDAVFMVVPSTAVRVYEDLLGSVSFLLLLSCLVV